MKKLIATLLLLCAQAHADQSIPIAKIASDINVSVIASRVSGAAPLLVVLDATGTTSAGVTSTPFSSIEYRWNFGDSVAGAAGTCGAVLVGEGFWACGSNAGGNSKNLARGPVAAHVYESAGTYTITGTFYDGTNTATQTITVTVTSAAAQWPTTQTICFSTGTLSSGCDTGATYVQNVTDLKTSIATCIAGANRCLLKRGDTFTSTTAIALTTTGPGMIGAFGSGALPIVRSSQAGAGRSIINISSATTPTITDWRLVDLDIDGQSNANMGGILGAGGMDKLTMLRLKVHDIGYGLSFAPDTLNLYNNPTGGTYFPGHHMWDQVAFVDSSTVTLVGGGGNVGYYCSGTRMAILGNKGSNSTSAEHIFRCAYASKATINNNLLENAATDKSVLTVRGLEAVETGQGSYMPYLLPAGPLNGLTVVSDNKYIGNSALQMVDIQPINAQTNIVITKVISERNWYVSGSGTTNQLSVQGNNITIRNEVFDSSAQGTNVSVAGVGGSGTASPASSAVQFYNNTFYSSATGANYTAITFNTGTTTMSAINNLGYAPNQSGGVMITDNGTASTKTTNTGNVGTTPNFTSVSPFTPTNAKPVCTAAYPCASGTAVPVWSDFFLVTEPATRDIGAVVH